MVAETSGSVMFEFSSMADLLRRRAAEQPNERAYVFLSERGGEEAALTFGDLERRASAVAAQLAGRSQKGDRALLMFPPGLDFIVAFFGCLMAGVIAVPIMPPRRTSARDASANIAANCMPRFALTTGGLIDSRNDIVERFGTVDLVWIRVDHLGAPGSRVPLLAPMRSDLAFLQYTSGSTSAPKGVMVSHANLLDNLEMIRVTLGNTRSSTCAAWIPFYHDMGLIMNVLQSLYVGALCVVLSPTSFIQRPLTWLRAIHQYRAEVASGPNFAYDLCVSRFRASQLEGIDLSCWRIALNGAEPVRAATIEQFVKTFAPYGLDPRSIYPGYGMAEATLMISGGSRGEGAVTRRVSREGLQRDMAVAPSSDSDARVIVGCGRPVIGEEIAIVHPESLQRLPFAKVGEIWVRGPHVAAGYWQNAAATAAAFEGCIAGEAGVYWLRTGDLGFVDEAGQLYITGRIKDVIILYGVNHYPQDIEMTMQEAHPALRKNGGAAFSVVDQHGQEKLVLVQEVERSQRLQFSPEEVETRIREAVSTEHDVSAHRIVLIRPGTIPKTTSGKIQRSLTRDLWQRNELDVLRPSDL
jgi:acyl-CoA synthetase (AMP-forming)/AMP-acid ligase II